MNKALKVLCMVSLLLMAVVISGCGNDGDKFVGKWTGLEHPDNPLSHVARVEITQNGDNFIVKRTMGYYKESTAEWDPGTERVTSTILKDGRLGSDNQFDTTTYTYDEKNKTLLYSGYGGVTLQKDDDGKIYEQLKAEGKPLADKIAAEIKENEKGPVENPFEKYGKMRLNW